MIKFEYECVTGWEAAIRGMRNPMSSWDRIDSDICSQFNYYKKNACKSCRFDDDCEYGMDTYIIGKNDLSLMKKLAKAGTDHSKFLRMVNVTVDITAPLYWWKEYDTYKVGTVANSTSTMHKIHAKEFTLDDFSHEHLFDKDNCTVGEFTPTDCLKATIKVLNRYRDKYIETNFKCYWWQMIQLLPSNYNQKRTVQLNYQVLLNMYHARKNHKLDEWHTFCEWVEKLPYFKEICLEV